MFPGEEWVTLASSLALLYVAIASYKWSREASALWVIAGLGFLFVSAGLAISGLEALENPLTPFIGALYPGFLASGIIAANTGYWRPYVAFVIAMLALMSIGKASGVEALMGASEGILHSVSGLVIIFMPLYYVYKKISPSISVLVSVGGLLISIGGVALASIAAGSPLLPPDLVISILHPVLFLSALTISLGLYTSRALKGA
ncbi:MAG: hypothetical protein LRS43_04435 [Desulfurococcales archaeon]|nr:hypothetical protein [Desulfurococcales archaeon]